jgi:hypothetical protein
MSCPPLPDCICPPLPGCLRVCLAFRPDLTLEPRTKVWLKEAKHLFYAFHYYGTPHTVGEAIKNALEFGKRHCTYCTVPYLQAQSVHEGEHSTHAALAGSAVCPLNALAVFCCAAAMPSLLTEYGGYGSGCDTQGNATAAGVGSAYWHYSDYVSGDTQRPILNRRWAELGAGAPAWLPPPCPHLPRTSSGAGSACPSTDHLGLFGWCLLCSATLSTVRAANPMGPALCPTATAPCRKARGSARASRAGPTGTAASTATGRGWPRAEGRGPARAGDSECWGEGRRQRVLTSFAKKGDSRTLPLAPAKSSIRRLRRNTPAQRIAPPAWCGRPSLPCSGRARTASFPHWLVSRASRAPAAGTVAAGIRKYVARTLCPGSFSPAHRMHRGAVRRTTGEESA